MPDLLQIAGNYIGVSQITDIKSGYATFVTFILAIFLGVVAFTVNFFVRRSEFRHENSTEFIAAHKENVMKALKTLNALSTKKHDSQQTLSFIRKNVDDFMTAVTHFETVAVYVATGHASERLVFMIEGGNMARLFESIREFVLDARDDEPRALLHFEGLYIRYKFGRYSTLSIMLYLYYWDKILARRRSFLIHYTMLQVLYGYEGSYLRQDSAEIRRNLYALQVLLNVLFLIAGYALISRISA